MCFTDNHNLRFNSGNWDIRGIPAELEYLSEVKKQRTVKACPHKYLGDYEVSLWVDGNISIISDIRKFIDQYDLFKTPIYVKPHPCRKCLYEEANAVLRYYKDVEKNVNPQIKKYREEGFPRNFGLFETSVILRRHNDQKCQLFSNLWASQIFLHSHRDQLSFDYCRWKTGTEVGKLKIDKLSRDKNFRWRSHGS